MVFDLMKILRIISIIVASPKIFKLKQHSFLSKVAYSFELIDHNVFFLP